MSRRSTSAAVAALASLALAAPAAADNRDPINGYRVQATPQNLEKLAMAGFDVTEGRRGSKIEVFGTATQIAKLRTDGVKAKAVRDAKGRTAAQRQRARSAQAEGADDSPYQVWTKYDPVAGDGKEQYLEYYSRLLRQYRQITKKVVIGQTHQGRDIVAIKVTRGARNRKDGSRPAVLYNALQHAREWLAGETCRRTLDYFVTGYGDNARITRLVDTRELWFVCVANPDGYEYTFTPGNRLWRKNMADNDGDGVRGEPNDGVDPNRNFATNFGLDDEGSSSDPTSETYRGTAPDSEPETQAMKRLWDRVDFAFQKNDHTAAELLLYPQGFQKFTPTADNSIFEALAGRDHESAIQDDEEAFDPDLSAELYITNGDTLDDGYHEHGILGFTPEGTNSRIPGVTGFEFEDDEQEVEEEFQRHREFALDLAESAADPENPESHLGNEVEDFYVDRFALSYGDPQPVQVTAKRSLGKVTMHYRINGGREQTAAAKEFRGGERYYDDPGVYYHRLRGVVEGTRPGNEVTVWFEARNRQSSRFTYTAQSESRRRALVIADENYSGPVSEPEQDDQGPDYADDAQQALQANGIQSDVYDVDANDMTAPHPLGVLSHYDLVVWEKGNDYVTRRPGQPGQTGQARVAIETQLAVRDFLNEGGRLFFTGQSAGRQDAEGYEFRNFGFPEPDEDPAGRWCGANDTEFVDGCIPPDNDFQQYYLGASIYVGGGNAQDEQGNPLPILGLGDPFGPVEFTFNGADSAANQAHTATFAVTSSLLDPDEFPWYADSRRLAAWQRPGAGPFTPFSGTQFMSAGADSQAFKRLRRTIDLTGATSGSLSFKFSADLEPTWDYMAVEVREVGTENWTTLPAQEEGVTSQDTGQSCPSGWAAGSNALHPQLLHYQTVNADGTCSPTGTTGAWNAFTGNSGGWQDWTVDLGAYAGKNIEVSISVITDWGTLGVGVWVDDAKVTVGGTETVADFEADEGGWQLGPSPEDSVNQVVGWHRTEQEFEEGPVIGTDDTVYTGFGFEGITGAEQRNAFMRGVLTHLGIIGDN
jgi:murein tripeptide amidase MpaA